MPGLLVHEWIERSGGAEQVLEAMAKAFPDAGIYCLWNDAPDRLTDRHVQQSWLARTPIRRHKAVAAPLELAVWRGLRADRQHDWMLISSHHFAHHAQIRAQTVPKYVYAHTPARYLWEPGLDSRGRHPLVRLAAPALRGIDRARAAEATAIATNSAFVRDRIALTWRREATVIHPPVAVERILAMEDWREAVTAEDELRVLDALPASFALAASRFVPYKRLDLALEAAVVAEMPVIIAGHGPEERRLRQLASAYRDLARIVVDPSDALLYALMQQASVFVFPPIEDFGIVAVEAQAAGTPVVTGPIGGQVEALQPGVSGVIADSTKAIDLARAIQIAADLPRFDRQRVVAKFDTARFVTQIQQFVAE